jgi:hypothetical protein
MGDLMEMFKKAVEMRNAGLNPLAHAKTLEQPKRANVPSFVSKAPIVASVVDMKILADGEDVESEVVEVESGIDVVDYDEPENWWDR